MARRKQPAPQIAGLSGGMVLVALAVACRLEPPVAADYVPTETETGTTDVASSSGALDEASTGPDVVCGNAMVDADERCDGIELGGEDCVRQGFDGGLLACASDCMGFDTRGCISFTCGDGNTEGSELCDLDDLGGVTCQDEGFDGGTLGCMPDCMGYDIAGCGLCSDAAINGDELCDGSDLAGETCSSQGFDSGTLACGSGCSTFDTSGCGTCGNDVTDGTETCDGLDLVGETCVSQGFDSGALACDSGCGAYDTSGCGTCGNGLADGTETCDGLDMVGESCTSQGFDSGALACTGSCTHDTSGCGTCGNGLIDGSEICDSLDLSGATCASLGFFTGPLACTGGCGGFDTSGCTDCGNGALDAGEDCDGFDLGGADCVSLLHTGGTLACAGDCVHDQSACTDHPLPTSEEVIITEIMHDPDVLMDADGEWFELHNATGADRQLLGCEVEGAGAEGFTIDIDLPIGPGEYRIFATDSGVDQGFVPDYQWADVDHGLSNGFDVVRLVCDGVVVDEVSYDDGVTFPDPTGKSMSLDPGFYDALENDLGPSWCAGSVSYNGDFGTPGADNPVCEVGAPPTNLLFSEYLEGSGNNKALEIYNASGVTVDLGDCAIRMYFGGNLVPNTTVLLGGLLPDQDVFVACDDDIAMAAQPFCDVLSPWSFFNGDDAIDLVCNGITFDVIGQIGFNPGAEWNVAGVGTADETLRRHCGVTMGGPNGGDPFDPSLEWNSFAENTFDDLGQHDCPSCAPVISEPGADLCAASFPDNFVPFSAVYDGFATGCGGVGTAVGIGYAAWPYVTFLSEPVDIEVGDQITVSYTAWAGGSTGSIEIEASVSPDGVTWSPCGIAPGRNFLGNNTTDAIVCNSPFGATELYVRLETTALSSALVYLRDFFAEVCG